MLTMRLGISTHPWNMIDLPMRTACDEEVAKQMRDAGVHVETVDDPCLNEKQRVRVRRVRTCIGGGLPLLLSGHLFAAQQLNLNV